jgi:hypothetical protein
MFQFPYWKKVHNGRTKAEAAAENVFKSTELTSSCGEAVLTLLLCLSLVMLSVRKVEAFTAVFIYFNKNKGIQNKIINFNEARNELMAAVLNW